MAKQSTQGSVAARSVDGGDETAGYTTWQGVPWQGKAGPFPRWMLTDNSIHLWRVDLPADLPTGAHRVTVMVTDPHGRVFTDTMAFEVVEEMPNMAWQSAFWE